MSALASAPPPTLFQRRTDDVALGQTLADNVAWLEHDQVGLEERDPAARQVWKHQRTSVDLYRKRGRIADLS